MAFVVMRHRSASAALDGEPGRGPVERLDLTFLVDAQHQGFVWRIQIESHDIGHLFQEVLLAAELEGFNYVRFEIVSLPICFLAHTLLTTNTRRSLRGVI